MENQFVETKGKLKSVEQVETLIKTYYGNTNCHRYGDKYLLNAILFHFQVIIKSEDVTEDSVTVHFSNCHGDRTNIKTAETLIEYIEAARTNREMCFREAAIRAYAKLVELQRKYHNIVTPEISSENPIRKNLEDKIKGFKWSESDMLSMKRKTYHEVQNWTNEWPAAKEDPEDADYDY